MGAKFRLGPMIDVYQSRRLEDQTRKSYPTRSRQAEKEREKRKPVLEKTYPSKTTEGKSTQAVGIDREADGDETATSARSPAKSIRALPYVDVPPLRSALKPVTLTAPVSARKVTITSPTDQSTDDVIVNDIPKREVNDRNDIPKGESAYRSRAPVEVGLDIESIVDKVLDLEINIPLRSLAGVSGTIQKEIRRQVTKTRQVSDDKKKVHWANAETQNLTNVDSLPMSEYMIMEEVSDDIPEGHLVASDPVLQYILENQDAEPRKLIVARPSESLRAIFITINGVGQEECLLDDGSMIVSMSKVVATELGLTWDPEVRINMESASNHVEKSLGIAKNVCFNIGGLDLFLQVHILEKPPYRVLLGRPFSVFASCRTKVFPDGATEITITDPNTRATATIPTYQRGMGPEQLQKQRYQSF
jgi:hypothetical protein